MKIALLSSDFAQTAVVRDALASMNHECHAVQAMAELMLHLRRSECHLLVIESVRPGESTHEALAWTRANLPSDMPVLLIAQRAATDILPALAAGASDYLVVPVRRAELVLRVQVLLQRAYPDQSASQPIVFGAFSFEKNSGRLLKSGVPIDLTQKEFDLALLFFRNLGRPLSRVHIQEAVWGEEALLPTRTMDTHVSRIRNKLQLRPEYGFRLAPVYSYGYRLEQLGLTDTGRAP